MNRCFVLSLFGILLIVSAYPSQADVVFGDNYYMTWGPNHLTIIEQGKQVQLLIDEYSGAGFSSRLDYGSGYFRMWVKLPNKNSKGTVTSFYLTSKSIGQQGTNHDELDFEFLGGNGMPYILHTNLFANDEGQREQQFHLWFDPTTNFHVYEILWNQHQIVFFVDQIPIRVFKNNTKLGVSYPSKSMHIEASMWNSTGWLGEVDWSQGPFKANFQGFDIDGCEYKSSSINPLECYSSSYAWNGPDYWKLNSHQQRDYEHARKNYVVYDYCTKMSKDHPECAINI